MVEHAHIYFTDFKSEDGVIQNSTIRFRIRPFADVKRRTSLAMSALSHAIIQPKYDGNKGCSSYLYM